jgi:hypothetical protein
MAEIVELKDWRPEPLPQRDGEPVLEVRGLVWWQGCPVIEDAWGELADRRTNAA